MTGFGDRLARGASSASFGPPKVTQERWDKIWGEEPKHEGEESSSAMVAESHSNKGEANESEGGR